MTDPWTTKCVPSGGSIDNKDIYNRRNGKRPNDQMVKVLQDTIKQVDFHLSSFGRESPLFSGPFFRNAEIPFYIPIDHFTFG